MVTMATMWRHFKCVKIEKIPSYLDELYLRNENSFDILKAKYI